MVLLREQYMRFLPLLLPWELIYKQPQEMLPTTLGLDLLSFPTLAREQLTQLSITFMDTRLLLVQMETLLELFMRFLLLCLLLELTYKQPLGILAIELDLVLLSHILASKQLAPWWTFFTGSDYDYNKEQ